MEPLFVATEPFDPTCVGWEGYMSGCQISQLREVVSLDGLLCPSLLVPEEDYGCYKDLDSLIDEIAGIPEYNLLCVYHEPKGPPPPYRGSVTFELLGYDLIEADDWIGGISALTNCPPGFPKAFANSELSTKGLIESYERAREVQRELRRHYYPQEPHADCDIWSIARALEKRHRSVFSRLSGEPAQYEQDREFVLCKQKKSDDYRKYLELEKRYLELMDLKREYERLVDVMSKGNNSKERYKSKRKLKQEIKTLRGQLEGTVLEGRAYRATKTILPTPLPLLWKRHYEA